MSWNKKNTSTTNENLHREKKERKRKWIDALRREKTSSPWDVGDALGEDKILHNNSPILSRAYASMLSALNSIKKISNRRGRKISPF